jgi:acylglycerol lipase
MSDDVRPNREPTDLVALDGTHLRGEAWVPDENSRAVVVIAHGKDEHIGRYRHVISALNEHRYAVYGHDHRGHGKSDGPRGVINRFDDYVDDLDLLVDFARGRHPGVPFFLLGHSMGGLIATRYAFRFQDKLTGLILSGAALRIGDEVPSWQKQLLLILGRFLPNKTLPRAELGVLSRDPEIERIFRSDPLCIIDSTRLGFARELYLAAESARRRLSELEPPLLIMHGEADRLTSPLGSMSCYEGAVSTDKTLKLWPEDCHEIFNELDKSEVIAYMIDWLNARTTG